MSLGAKIKELREEHGWTKGQLEQKAVLSPGYVSDIESGEKVKHPSAVIIIKIANALRVDPDELFVAAGYMKPKGPETLPPPDIYFRKWYGVDLKTAEEMKGFADDLAAMRRGLRRKPPEPKSQE